MSQQTEWANGISPWLMVMECQPVPFESAVCSFRSCAIPSGSSSQRPRSSYEMLEKHSLELRPRQRGDDEQQRGCTPVGVMYVCLERVCRVVSCKRDRCTSPTSSNSFVFPGDRRYDGMPFIMPLTRVIIYDTYSLATRSLERGLARRKRD